MSWPTLSIHLSIEPLSPRRARQSSAVASALDVAFSPTLIMAGLVTRDTQSNSGAAFPSKHVVGEDGS